MMRRHGPTPLVRTWPDPAARRSRRHGRGGSQVRPVRETSLNFPCRVNAGPQVRLRAAYRATDLVPTVAGFRHVVARPVIPHSATSVFVRSRTIDPKFSPQIVVALRVHRPAVPEELPQAIQPGL